MKRKSTEHTLLFLHAQMTCFPQQCSRFFVAWENRWKEHVNGISLVKGDEDTIQAHMQPMSLILRVLYRHAAMICQTVLKLNRMQLMLASPAGIQKKIKRWNTEIQRCSAVFAVKPMQFYLFILAVLTAGGLQRPEHHPEEPSKAAESP